MPRPATSSDLDRIKEMRGWIAAAVGQGTPAELMLLRLTVRDAATLKRHPAVAVHEIAFAGGEMRFLGVKVREGGVAQSALEAPAK